MSDGWHGGAACCPALKHGACMMLPSMKMACWDWCASFEHAKLDLSSGKVCEKFQTPRGYYDQLLRCNKDV